MALTRVTPDMLNSTTEYFNTPFLVLHQGATQANVDVGFLFNRGLGTVPNVALYWNESSQSIVTAFTNNTGTTGSNITTTGYANLTVGSVLTINGSAIQFQAGSGIVVNGSFGNIGQVLVADGAGGLQWAAPGAFSGGTLPNKLIISNTTPSTSTSTGALQVTGGAGIAGNVYSGNVYTSGLYWSGNGQPMQTGAVGVTGIAANSSVLVTYTTAATSTTSGALQVEGGLGVAGAIYSNQVFTNGLFWAGNGVVIQTGGGSGGTTNYITNNLISNVGTVNPALYTGVTSITTVATLVDSIPVTGNASFRWALVATDNYNNRYASSYVDTVNDGTNVYYTHSGVVKSNPSYNVATFTSNISGGNINLWAIGDSGSVTVSFERTTLGSSTYNGYASAMGPTGPTWQGGILSNTVTISNSTNSTSTSTGALTVAGGIGVAGNVYSGNVYTSGLFWAGNGNVIQTGGGSGTGITYTASATAPTTGNTVGSQWYNTTTNALYSYEFDGSNYYWVDITTPVIGGTSTANIFFGSNLVSGANVTGTVPTANTSIYVGVTAESTGTWYPTMSGQYVTGNVQLGIASAFSVNAVTGNLTVPAANIGSGGIVSSGNITSANIVTGNITSSGNITSGNVTASGFFFSNGVAYSTSNYGNAQVLANLAATGNPITVGSNLTVTGNTIVNGGQLTVGNGVINSTTVSTSTTTGALVVSGGAGIAGNVYVGGNLTANISVATASSVASSAGYLGMPQNTQSSGTPYTLALSDAGKQVFITTTGNIVVPANSSVSFPVGTAIAIIANASVTSNILITSDTMFLGGTGTTGTRVLASYGMATLTKVAPTVWFISGIGLS